MILYRDIARFYKLGSTGYANSKVVESSDEVLCVFLQNTAFLHTSNQDAIDSDGVLYPDINNSFVKENANRLEGMNVKVKMYGSVDSESWYKIINVSVNRDHLLENKIDNIECLLKKTRPVEGDNGSN